MPRSTHTRWRWPPIRPPYKSLVYAHSPHTVEVTFLIPNIVPYLTKITILFLPRALADLARFYAAAGVFLRDRALLAPYGAPRAGTSARPFGDDPVTHGRSAPREA